jgi:hypothetical protein
MCREAGIYLSTDSGTLDPRSLNCRPEKHIFVLSLIYTFMSVVDAMCKNYRIAHYVKMSVRHILELEDFL